MLPIKFHRGGQTTPGTWMGTSASNQCVEGPWGGVCPGKKQRGLAREGTGEDCLQRESVNKRCAAGKP